MIRRLLWRLVLLAGRWRYRESADPDGTRCYLCPAESDDSLMICLPLCTRHIQPYLRDA
jgi:hypothetical protein